MGNVKPDVTGLRVPPMIGVMPSTTWTEKYEPREFVIVGVVKVSAEVAVEVVAELE